MTEPYDEAVAAHYAAYRPPLHRRILEEALAGDERFSVGLDVGCGTGRSSIALAAFCERVIAVDPSQAMIDAAIPHHAIAYHAGSGEHLPVGDQSIDIATFAGSLSYMDTSRTARELCRVCRPGSVLITYDFEVLIDELMRPFGIEENPVASGYDHAANFSGASRFTEVTVHRDRIEFGVAATELAHLFLADHARHSAFVDRYKTASPLARLSEDLGSSDATIAVRADVFFSVYRLAEPSSDAGETP